MTLKTPIRLGAIQETLLVPLWARAREFEQPEPLLRDPKSREILERLDYDFTPLENARASQLGCCVRGALVDRWVRDFLARHPDGTVVEIGVGLNSRFERVDNGRANWVEIDLPDVIGLRREFFADSPRRRMISASAHGDEWIGPIRETGAGPVFFASEGVLVYFRPDEVRTLFRRVAENFPGAQFAYDSMSPLVIRHQRHHDAMRHFEADFTWAVADVSEVERWDDRVRIEESRSFYRMLYAHPHRLPLHVRYLGPLLGAVYPPVKRAYQVNRLRISW